MSNELAILKKTRFAGDYTGGRLMFRHSRIFVFAIATLYAVAFSIPIHAQWNTGSGGTIYHDGGNVGIGTTMPDFGRR
jgi:hypothetical protein